MSNNIALRINLKEKSIEQITLKTLNDKQIKKNIKKIFLFPIILEKIVMEYDTHLTLIAVRKTYKKKSGDGFYYKGYYINSNAIILKTSFTDYSDIIEYSQIDDIEFCKKYLEEKILFDIENICEYKKLQIEIMDLIIKCEIDPFSIVPFYDNKYILRVKKIIDAIDIVASIKSNNTLEILKGVLKNLKVVALSNNLQEKRATCVNILQNMCKNISIKDEQKRLKAR